MSKNDTPADKFPETTEETNDETRLVQREASIGGLHGAAETNIAAEDVTVSLNVDAEHDGREWYRVIGLEIETGTMSFLLSLDEDEAREIGEQLIEMSNAGSER
jgi:hypothetical protein